MRAGRVFSATAVPVLALAAAAACAAAGSAAGGFPDGGGDETGNSTPGTGTGTGFGFTSGSTGTGTGLGITTDSGKGTDTGSTVPDSGGGCTGNMCCPHALPAGFAAVLHPTPGAKCSPSDLSTLATDCNSTTGTVAGCQTQMATPCGDCISGATNTAADWGPELVITTSGATPAVPVPYPNYNFGGCVLTADPSASGTACAQSFQAQIECELAACLAYCPVTSASDSVGINALVGTYSTTTGELVQKGCIEDADESVCAGIILNQNTACASDFSDAGTGLGDRCQALAVASNNTAAGFEQFAGPYCGGADGGL